MGLSEAAVVVAVVVGTVLVDRTVRSHAGCKLAGTWRAAPGWWLTGWLALALLGAFLAISGALLPAAVVVLALATLFAIASNAKLAVLGEPLLFSDLALVGAIFRHPQFYLSALGRWQRAMLLPAALALGAIFALLFETAPSPHLAGAGLLMLAVLVIAASASLFLRRGIAASPDAATDVRRLGLGPTLLLYWLRWRQSDNPAPPEPLSPAPPSPESRSAQPLPSALATPELVIVVQCESFADPAALFAHLAPDDTDLQLPALSRTRATARRAGRLMVSGFGAYTMRTEYGVLFGREEEALGFRRYDPYLTAMGELPWALPRRIAGLEPAWRSVFVHPHDMRFYGRDRILPAAGFDELVGETAFAPPSQGQGRYVSDAAVADQLLALARAASGPTMLYAVTMENHGPWAPRGSADSGARAGEHASANALIASYLRLVRRSDAMLDMLERGVAALARPALLVFFGDHRPSIPGACVPGGERHTPYVMLRFDAFGRVVGNGPQDRHPRHDADLTPAALHAAILAELV